MKEERITDELKNNEQRMKLKNNGQRMNERTTDKIMTMHHPKSDTDSLYLTIEKRGRGLI